MYDGPPPCDDVVEASVSEANGQEAFRARLQATHYHVVKGEWERAMGSSRDDSGVLGGVLEIT